MHLDFMGIGRWLKVPRMHKKLGTFSLIFILELVKFGIVNGL